MVSMAAVLVKTFYRTEINFVTLNDFWFYNLHYDVNIDLAVFIAKYLFMQICMYIATWIFLVD